MMKLVIFSLSLLIADTLSDPPVPYRFNPTVEEEDSSYRHYQLRKYLFNLKSKEYVT